MAIARAMCEVNAENRGVLKPEGLLTRDPRMVERKKFGQKKARKRFQFSIDFKNNVVVVPMRREISLASKCK